MIRRNSLALVLLAFASIHASADILLEGSKWIRHTVVIDNLDDHPDLAFFTFVTFLNYAAPIRPAKPLDIGNGNPFNGIYVVGIPRDRLQALGGKPQPDWFPEVTGGGSHRGPPFGFPIPEGVLISSTEVPHIRAASQTDPTEHLITNLAIGLEPASAKGPAHLVLREVGEDRLDRAGKPINRQADSAADTAMSAVSDPSPAWLWAGLPLIALGGIAFLALRKRGTPRPRARRPTAPACRCPRPISSSVRSSSPGSSSGRSPRPSPAAGPPPTAMPCFSSTP